MRARLLSAAVLLLAISARAASPDGWIALTAHETRPEKREPFACGKGGLLLVRDADLRKAGGRVDVRKPQPVDVYCADQGRAPVKSDAGVLSYCFEGIDCRGTFSRNRGLYLSLKGEAKPRLVGARPASGLDMAGIGPKTLDGVAKAMRPSLKEYAPKAFSPKSAAKKPAAAPKASRPANQAAVRALEPKGLDPRMERKPDAADACASLRPESTDDARYADCLFGEDIRPLIIAYLGHDAARIIEFRKEAAAALAMPKDSKDRKTLSDHWLARARDARCGAAGAASECRPLTGPDGKTIAATADACAAKAGAESKAAAGPSDASLQKACSAAKAALALTGEAPKAAVKASAAGAVDKGLVVSQSAPAEASSTPKYVGAGLGAAGGAMLGFALGGPLGALLGAAAGGAGGFFAGPMVAGWLGK